MNSLAEIVERHTKALGFFVLYLLLWVAAAGLLAYGKYYSTPDTLLAYPAFLGAVASVLYCVGILLAALLSKNETRFYLKLLAYAFLLPVGLIFLATIW